MERGIKPIRTVCCYCPGYGREQKVIVDVPLDGRGLSHGMCPECSEDFLAGRPLQVVKS